MKKKSKKSTKTTNTKTMKTASARAPNARRSKKHGAKSAFIRRFPHLSAKEIVALAKQSRIRIPIGLVYNVRTLDNKNNGSTGHRSNGKKGWTIAKIDAAIERLQQVRSSMTVIESILE